jgi:deoxyadenosine/deoxycytidine kinase
MTAGADAQRRQGPRFIAVEGPIGAGKTTLARKLAGTLGYETLLENAEQNPFLERFYRNRAQNALATQLYFLFQRAQQLDELRQADLFHSCRVADFLIEKDRLFAQLNLEEQEYALYERVYERLVLSAPLPDLVIYLQAPVDVLIERVQRRAIAFEQLIERRYLERLNESYSRFFHYYDDAPLLIVNAAAIDFANDDNHYNELVEYLLGIRSGRHYFNPTFF